MVTRSHAQDVFWQPGWEPGHLDLDVLRLGCVPRKGTLSSPAQPRPGETPQSETRARELLPSVREGVGLQLGEVISRENGGVVPCHDNALTMPCQNHAEVGQPL